jgi:2-isopropylmalate synthase
VEGGARQIECTINGLGERAGNAALEEVVMAIETRGDVLHYRTGINTKLIARASKLVSAVSAFPVQYNKAIVGKNAFAHESGIHQDGVLKNAQTYEIMTPESVGLKESSLVMGKHSGRHAFREKLQEMGYQLGENALEAAFQAMKDLADKKKHVFDEDIEAIADQGMATASDRIKVLSMTVIAGTGGPQRATVTLDVDGRHQTAEANGDGPVDAIFKAIRAIVPHDATLPLFQVHAVTEGTDAQAEVSVRLEEGGKTVTGRGSDTDTLVAAARAYVSALNKLMNRREKSAPEAMTAV